MMDALRSPVLDPARRAYALALRARYGLTGMPWRVHGEIVRIDPRVRHLVPRDAEPALFEFLRAHVRAGDVVLDLGAFLGIYAVLEARWAGAGGRVIAVEPTPSTASMARTHLRWNAAADAARTELFQGAVSDAVGRATFYEYPLPYVNALAPANDSVEPGAAIDVPTITIDELCASAGVIPTVIRMDVQGAEWHALHGARETIRRAGARLTIVVETHPQCWPSFGVDERMAMAIIESLNLDARPLCPGAALFARDAHLILTPRRP
jgi:FkbM family methyltransferase